MSDTGDSEDNSIETYLNCRRRGLGTSSSNQNSNNKNQKRKIVMKIEFDDSDDDDGDSDISYSDGDNNDSNDEVKPSTSNRKRLLQSSDEDSDTSNNSEITRKIFRGRKIDKNPIISEEEDDDNYLQSSKSPKHNINDNDDGFNSDSSSNDALEKCPICLFSFRNQEIGIPNICEHRFCALCIEEWSKNVQTCPIDRQEFTTIKVYDKITATNILREIKVIKQIDEKSSINEDITYCEICQQGNREDVMLLCDGCNQGFHIFCLTPQLEQIPDGFWYCDNCFDSDDDTDLADDLNALYDDIRDLGIPESRLRITEVRQPRILRTRQSERIRASIVARTRSGNSNNAIDINAPSTSRALIEHSVNGDRRRRLGQTTTTTTTTTLTTTTRKTTKRKTVARKRNTTRRRRRKTKKPRSRTYVVEYDINNFDDKFALKTTKKYIRKKRTKRRVKGRKKSKFTNAERNFKQENGKRKKYVAEQMGIKRLNKYERPLNSSQSLSLFGNVNDLEYFSDSNNFEENEFGGGDMNGGSTALQTSVRFGNLSSLRHRKGIKPNIQPPANNPADLLSNLLDMQDRFLNATRQDQINAVRIGSDGSINFGENLNINQTNSDMNNDNNSKENEVNSNDINQAPMFPWNNNQRNNGGQGGINRGGGGGGGGSYNNRFNNQSNYRNSGGGGGGNYRHSTGGMGGPGNNNFRFQMNQNNPNFTPNYRDRFNRNNQRNRRNQNQNNSNSNDNNNEQNVNFNNNNSLLNRELNSPTNYNDDNTNRIDSFNNPTTTSPQQENRRSPLPAPRIITSEEVTNSILGLKPSTSSNDGLEDNITDFSLNRNNLNPPSLHVPPLNMPPPINFTSLHYPTLSQPLLTPSLNHPPPLIGSLICPVGGSLANPIGPIPGPAIRPATGPTIGPMIIDFSQPPPPPPPLPKAESSNQNKTESEKKESSTNINGQPMIGPQPLIPPPWNENLFKLATDYCDDDNDDDCPNFSVYSAESLQVANSTATKNIHGDKAQEDEFDADEDLVQLGDDDDIPNSIDNSENRNRIEFKIMGPKLYKPDNTVVKLRENVEDTINKDKTETNIIADHDKNKIGNETESEKLEEDNTADEIINDKRIEGENSEKQSDDEMKSNENINQNNDINEETNDEDESSTNELTPVAYNDLDKPTNETDTDTTTNTPLINLKNKKGVLELYDDSDWEELNIEREQLRQKIAIENSSLIGPQLEKDENNEYINKDDIDLELLNTVKLKDISTHEEIGDRSYTPCLDEKDDHDDVVQISANDSPPIISSSCLDKKNQDTEKDESGIEGIETELISDGEIIVGEQGKTGKKKEDKKKSDDKNDSKSNLKKSRRSETFKKVTKNQRERNYRVERTDAIRERPNRHSRSRSHSNDKENKDRDKNRRSRDRRNSRNRFRRIRRKEIVRYNVRNIINQPRTYKDRYGRDTSRPARSRSRSRPIRISRSRSRSHIRSPVRSRSRSRSRSLSSIRKNVRSFSMSPSPLSPQGYRGRRPFSPRGRRPFSPIGRRRSRTPLRIRSRSRSRSNSISDRATGPGDRRQPSSNRMKQRSLSNSSKSKSPQAYTPAPKRSGSVLKNRKRKRSKERKKRKTRRRNSSISSPPQQQEILQHSKRLSRPRERTSPNIIPEPVISTGVANRKKKSRRSRTKSPIIDRVSVQNRGWTTSPEYNPNEKGNDISWTPPIQSPPQHGGFRVMFKEPRKKREKKKKIDKRKERSSGNNRKDKRNKNKDKTPQAPSKEVFASGDNILVSVSFNKDTTDTNAQPQQTTVVTLPPTRAEIVSNRRQSSIERQRSRRNKDQSSNNPGGIGSNQQRQRKHRKINIKPVAIIDLDRSPFQVIQVPRDIIVLTDSENENDQRLNPDGVDGGGDGGDNGDRRSSSVGLDEQQQQLQQQLQQQQQEQQHRENSINRSVEMNDDDEDDNRHHHHHENGHHRLRQIDDDDDDDDDDEINNNKTPERNNDRSDSNLPYDSYSIQQLGPKTPYFVDSDRERNRLEMQQQQLQQQQQMQQQQQQQLLQQQQQQQQLLQQQQHQEEEQDIEIQKQQQNITKIGPNTPPESGPCSPDVYDPFDPTKSPSASPESQFLEEDELPSHSTISDKDLSNNESALDRERKLDKNNMNPADLVKALMNTSQDLSKLKKSDQQQQYSNNNNNNNNSQMQSIDNDNLIPEEQQQTKSVQVLSNVLLSLGKSHHHIPLISSPPSSSLKQNQQQSQGFVGITKLPQNMSSKATTGGTNSNNYRHNGSSNDDIINEVDSPYSPCSDDFDDLFDPPPETSSANNRNRNKNASKNTHKYSKTVEIFDNLFGSTSPVGTGTNRLPLPGLGGFASSSARKQKTKTNKKTSVKVAKIPGIGKIDEEQIKIYDDLPNSAVELQVKDKFLRKLNRQERVVEEVKLVLKPHYNRKHITKDEYKEILRRSVPKICHSKSGEINPKKIHNLIEAYVKKFRQRNKLGIGMNTGQVSTAVKCAAYLKKL